MRVSFNQILYIFASIAFDNNLIVYPPIRKLAPRYYIPHAAAKENRTSVAIACITNEMLYCGNTYIHILYIFNHEKLV